MIDLEGVDFIRLEHESMGAEVHITIHEGSKLIRPYWVQSEIIAGEWFTTRVIVTAQVDTRTEWNDPTSGTFVGQEAYWDHHIDCLPAKLAAYERAGYRITDMRYESYDRDEDL